MRTKVAILSTLLTACAEPDQERVGPGEPCGGPQAIGCEEGYHCESGDNSSWQTRVVGCEEWGECVEASGLFAPHLPVCGCDRVTYSNWWYMQEAGARFAYEGECQ